MADITTFYPGGPDDPVDAAEIAAAVSRMRGDGTTGAMIEFWTGTQAQYDVLAPPAGPGYDEDTLYIIIPTP